MHYATHCIGPVLALTGKDCEWVSCLGSGRVEEKYARHYGSPFAVETAHMRLKNSDVHAEITRSLYNTAREYVESFDAYGSERTFEWTQVEGEPHVMHLGEEPSRIDPPDFAHLLPEEILIGRGTDQGGSGFIDALIENGVLVGLERNSGIRGLELDEALKKQIREDIAMGERAPFVTVTVTGEQS